MTTDVPSRDDLNRSRAAVESRSTDVDCSVSAYHSAVRAREDLEAHCRARLSPLKDNKAKFNELALAYDGWLSRLTKDGESLRTAQNELVNLWLAAGKRGKAREAATAHLGYWNAALPSRRFSDGGVMHDFLMRHRVSSSEALQRVST